MDTFFALWVATDLHLVFWTHKKQSKEKKRKKGENGEKNTVSDTMCGKHFFKLTRSHVSHTVSYYQNGQHILWQG